MLKMLTIPTVAKRKEVMDLSKITNAAVKGAISALQEGDESWYSYFIPEPLMTDDGRKTDFAVFSRKALGTEKFLSIDRVENDGKDVYGNFDAGQWGSFPVYFKFHQDADGKFYRLDIGQARH